VQGKYKKREKMTDIFGIISVIFSNAIIVYAVIVAIGLLLLRRPLTDVLVGILKAVMGYFMLQAGLGVIIGVVSPIGSWISQAFKITGVLTTFGPIFGMGSVKFGAVIGPAVLIAFLLNLLLARITPLKFVNITGHFFLMTSAWFCLIASAWNFSVLELILLVGIWGGIYNWLGTAMNYWPLKNAPEKRLPKDYSIGPFEVVGYSLTVFVTKAVNKVLGEDKITTETMEFPKGLEWLSDPSLAIASFAGLTFTIIGLLVGANVVTPYAGGLPWWLYLLFSGAEFQAGMLILLYGVRMLTAELVRGFKGISEKLIPNAIPGLDYPTFYHFSQLGVVTGFLGNFFGQLIGMGLQIVTHMPFVLIPDPLPAFFNGSIFGVYGNAYGGRRGAIIVPLIMGIAQSFLFMAIYPFTGGLAGSGFVWGYSDTYGFGLLFYIVVSILAPILGIPLVK